jgi:hypothetical protein
VTPSECFSASECLVRESRAANTRMAWGRAAVATAMAAAIVLGATACGDDDDDSTAATTAPAASGAATTTPEERQVSDAEVTAGLTALPPLVATAVATVGTDAAKEAYEPVHDSWESYEGTIRTKEPDLYLAIEDGLEKLNKALSEDDKTDAAEAQSAIQQAASDYLVKHP